MSPACPIYRVLRQAFVVSAALVMTNVLELALWTSDLDPAWMSLQHPHLLSATLLLPFVGVTFGLLQHNVFPASVFVGDTFCYFAGMTLAVSSILGHYSKTILIFFLPQILNFLYSVPQLFKLYPCPRHRLPRYVEQRKNNSNCQCLEHTLLDVYVPTMCAVADLTQKTASCTRLAL